ncbi:hypothetical protein CSIRO_3079 [Bradyrhizobiaceae bacterium SG-6C]|nr:hypothetical protein CSIRO_3079 [Bradyrhizobiaceae bacterium SG-6C]
MGKQRIIELRDEISRLENELAAEQEAYMAEAAADGILTEDFGEWRFQIQPNPPALDINKTSVPDFLFKPSIDQAAVRKYLNDNGRQPWGALRDDKPYKLVVTRIPLKAVA